MKAASLITLLLLMAAGPASAEPAAEQLRREYQEQGAAAFSAERGRALWLARQQDRSCTDCHTADPSGQGKHLKTGKPIAPLAPSVNPERLSDEKTIRKWLRRNCQWTFGRLCTPQEKGDLLIWLESY